MVAVTGIKEDKQIDISKISHRQLRVLHGKRKLQKKNVQKIEFKIVKCKVLNVFGASLNCKFTISLISIIKIKQKNCS